MILILAFTYGLIILWHPPFAAAAIFASVAVTCTVKFVTNHSEEADRQSFRWYEVCNNHRYASMLVLISIEPQLWFICAHILPVFERMSNGDIPSSFLPGLDFCSLSFLA
jgi:hypothetical protein